MRRDMEQDITQTEMPLVDTGQIEALEAAIGRDAMRGLIAGLLRDCEAGRSRLTDLRSGQMHDQLAREAHKLGGMLAHFGCPAAAHVFRSCARAESPGEALILLDGGLALLGPTCAALEAAYL
jgi:HPt (histidine-containing phosphotransfer) domain-containing protein